MVRNLPIEIEIKGEMSGRAQPMFMPSDWPNSYEARLAYSNSVKGYLVSLTQRIVEDLASTGRIRDGDKLEVKISVNYLK